MGAYFVDEVRALFRSWYLWPVPAVAAALAWWLVPLNDHLYRFVNGDPQSGEELALRYRVETLAVYTSGFSTACLLVLLAGAVMVVHDRRLAGRSTGSGRQPDVRRLLTAKVAVAGLFALLLGPICLVAALPRGDDAVAGDWPREASYEELTRWEPPALTVVIIGLLAFPLWAAAGVGLGAILGSWRRLAVLAAVPAFVAVLVVMTFNVGTLDDVPGPAGELVASVLGFYRALPVLYAGVWYALVLLSLLYAPVYVGLVAGTAAITLLIGQWRAKRRLIRSAARSPDAARP